MFSGKHVIVALFAGGVGSRMRRADKIPKQFIKVNGKEILAYTLDCFEQNPHIDEIYLATHPDWIHATEDLVEQYGYTKVKTVTEGGASAQESAYRALVAAEAAGVDTGETIALISDGVRPVIPDALIERCLAGVVEHGNSITSIPAFETVAITTPDGKIVADVPDRNLMYVLQAPQCFNLDTALALHRQSIERGEMGTFIDHAHMARTYGHDLHLVAGIRGNIKLTVKNDIQQFEYLVSKHPNGNYRNEIE
ncbi:IspD/TarI family cytidylyltransferase, partial [Timonella senegalensis]|uniref:IspD/TarI family cytidylyltransferase n=1 Tax=Timonella senegalensis TaxID=1465825 RepID=UPI002FE1DF18